MFDYMCKRNVISWTSIISSAAEQGFYSEAMNFFHRMESEGISPNKITLIGILEACSSLQEGFGIHISIVMRGYETDVIVATALIKMYGNFNGSSNAMYIFAAMPNKNVISWGAMITGLTQSGRAEEALEIFAEMSKQSVKLDEVIYVCVLNACSDHGAFKEGQSLHVKIIEDAFDRHIIVGNALITLYGRFGDLDGATVIFMKMPIRNTGTWSAIISACAQHGESAEALNFFHQMILEGFQPLIPTYVSVLDACGDVMAWEMGRTVHSTVVKHGMEMDTYIGNSLVNLYGKCGRVTEAKSAFVGLKQCDVISWNNIILAFSQAGYGNEALEYFCQMLNDGIEPNNMTLKLTMEACTGISKVKRTYETMVGNLCKRNSIVEAHLMKQYRGCIDNEASREDQQVFEQNSTQHWECIDTEASRVNQQVFNQNSMQVNTTSHLCKTSGNMQVSCFTYQTKLFEIKQNEIVCVTEKWDLYQRHLHDILASYPARKSFSSSNLAMDYYIGIIDILNHEGLLPEVEDLLKSAPTAAAITSWSSLLCASRFHGDLHRGWRAADHCIVLNKDSASPYSELLQLYAATG
ncbi:hypothetical protein KP509_32G042700 [Ceratopteris richardii]|nr:hypothetical protein KP509_32G042700 [Ceratopteris richardii]